MEIIQKNTRNFLKAAHKALDDKFGSDIKIIDLRGLSVLTDFFVVTNGGSEAQVKVLADEVQKALSGEGLKMRSSEGYSQANWILLDFDQVIVHVFDKPTREFYNIERIWGDAPLVELASATGGN